MQGHGEVDASRDVREFGLIRVAMGGSKDEASAWIERRLAKASGRNEGRQGPGRAVLRSAQIASLEAFGIKVEA